MIYLDYSATTPVCEDAINAICEAAKYASNPNSGHKIGLISNKRIEDDLNKMRHLLMLSDDMEIIPVSGATEANNLILRGAFERFYGRGKKHIVTTNLEHSSIIAPVSDLQARGAEIDFVKLLPDGKVDIDDLLNLVRDDTLMVSIGCINSEVGIRQPIEEIGKILKEKHPDVIFHTDATQAVGKISVDYSDVDALSLSAHKFFCIKGIGALIKKKDLIIIPQNKGGSSTTKFRAGTPATELIHAMTVSLEDALENMDKKLEKLRNLNIILRRKLSEYPDVIINSPTDAIPQILNFSYPGHNADAIQRFLSDRDIFISTRTACASRTDMSQTVLKLTNDENRAKSSMRISISYKTTEDEINGFMKAFDEYTKIPK